MKQVGLFLSLTLTLMGHLYAQTKLPDRVDDLDRYVGTYYPLIEPSSRFGFKKGKDNLILEIEGQGQTPMKKIRKDRFTPAHVRPKAIIEFIRDSTGGVRHFKWIQPIPGNTFQRIVTTGDSLVNSTDDPLSKYVGDYRLTTNRYNILRIRETNHQLTAQGTNEGKILIRPESGNRFVVTDGDMRMIYEFIPTADGKVNAIHFSRKGSISFTRTDEAVATSEVIYGFNHPNGFERADTLRGKLTSFRTCYDVLFYDLNVLVEPDKKMVMGENKIRFKAVHPFNQMQVDLFANMKIEKIIFRNKPLAYTRESNTVFIQFPEGVEEGVTDEILIAYSGKPQKPDGPSLAGGIFWLQDKDGEHWIETVSQGSGASLWWPCKDHLSDKPDSMKISITVPRGLTDISNGKLLKKTELAGNLTRFDWYVSYPITPYCVAMNIGNYASFKDEYVVGKDTLALNYYSMEYDREIARKLFAHVKPMLMVFEKDFGRYPFRRDGFSVMESIYPMEHQGAVSLGSFFNPFNSDQYDSLDLIRTMWHEVAHEWWGNNVTVKDFADLWIHEAFATYAEVLAYETLNGPQAAQRYLINQKPGNKVAMIGTYDVNDFRLGDVYSKGALMLNTLRNLLANDSIWFDLLRDIQQNFSYKSITTEDLVQYINERTKTDYRYFFEQYLTKPTIPELQLLISRTVGGAHVKYRWRADVGNFKMPAKITTSKNIYSFIYPTQEWKELDLKDIRPKDIRVDNENFYVNQQIQFGAEWNNRRIRK